MSEPLDETVFALSSAPGRAGVAVLRVSGSGAGPALEALAGPRPEARRAVLRTLRAPESGEALDRGLLLWFPAPKSFTGEDMAEFQVHGGRAVVGALLEALGALPGLRPAEPGEFTRRAFDNDRLDLSQVEGLADLIAAETEAQRRQALRQMSGALSRLSEAWRTRLVGLLAHAEAAIDFSDEPLPADLEAQLGPKILCLRDDIAQHMDDDRRGERLRDGLYVAIIGPPNAGKSSLLNALARREAAIVSATAGTTRDVIEVQLDLGGYPVTLADTAGLRALGCAAGGQAAIEAEGVRRARAGAEAADFKLAVFDLAAALDPAALDPAALDPAALDPVTGALVDGDTLVVLNKADIVPEAQRASLDAGQASVVSALRGTGMAALLERLEAAVAARLDGGAAALVTRARHRRALADCVAALGRAAAAPAPELRAEDLRLAVRALGRIAGRVDVEDLLDVIFRDFCIGK